MRRIYIYIYIYIYTYIYIYIYGPVRITLSRFRVAQGGLRQGMRRIYIYIYIYAISQGGCAGICASNFSPESSFSRTSFVWRWFFQGFCMFYVHLCRLKRSLSLTWGQPAGLPGTRGYAPHMRQVFFSRPRGGTLFHGQKRNFATSGGLRQDMRLIYIYIYAISLLFSGVCAAICAVYIYIYICDSAIFGARGLRQDMRRIYIYIYICDFSTYGHAV